MRLKSIDCLKFNMEYEEALYFAAKCGVFTFQCEPRCSMSLSQVLGFNLWKRRSAHAPRLSRSLNTFAYDHMHELVFRQGAYMFLRPAHRTRHLRFARCQVSTKE